MREPRARGRVWIAGVGVAVLGLVGCGEAEPGEDPEVAASPSEARTLETPPELEVGEWWTFEVETGLVTGGYEPTVVVTERADGTAALGMPADSFLHDLFVVHVPPLGDLDLERFAWRVMWDDFDALEFPLEPGRTWEADFHGWDVEAEVTAVEDGRAHVTMTGEEEHIELTYDAHMGMITSFEEEALQLHFRVVDHGFGYEGPVRTPRGIELAFMEGPPTDGGEAADDSGVQTTTVDVDTDGSHGSLGFVFSGTADDDGAGRYRMAATAPDGTRLEETVSGTPDAPPLVLKSVGHDTMAGPWELEFEADGPGSLLMELFTYDRLDGEPSP